MSLSYSVTIGTGIQPFTMVVDGSTAITSFVYSLDGLDKYVSGGTYNSITNLISGDLLINAVPELNNFLSEDPGYTGTYKINSTTSTKCSIFGTVLHILIDILINGPVCYNEGTKILCLNNKEEEYVAIENLRAGDIVKTYHYGYRKIELIGKNCLINHPHHHFTSSMYKMEKTETNGLIEDLIVTGGHSILVDDLGEQKELNEQMFGESKIEDKYLLLAAASKDFVKINDTKTYTFYHFILENDGDDYKQFGVWANGILSETMSKECFVKKSFIVM